MRKIDTSKLHNSDNLLDSKYGKVGTNSRKEFNKEAIAIAFYYKEIPKEKQK